MHVTTSQEGSWFAQRKGNDNPNTSDKKYWKDRECYKCGDKGHPESRCKTKLDSNRKNKNKDDKSSSVYSKPITHTMVGKTKKDIQKTNKSFTAMEYMIKNTEEEEDNLDISDSDSESGSAFF